MVAVGHKQYSTTLTFYNNPTREHQKQMWLKKASEKEAKTSSDSAAVIALLSRLKPCQLSLIEAKLQTMLTEGSAISAMG